jgi:hypothetical protein
LEVRRKTLLVVDGPGADAIGDADHKRDHDGDGEQDAAMVRWCTG